MKTICLTTLIALCMLIPVQAQQSEDALRPMAHAALEKLDSVEAVPFERTTHPNAMWYPEASFGLFMHWGIHSVAALEPSWAMMKGCPWQEDYEGYDSPEQYYTLAPEFNPQNYDPDTWMKAAKDAGFTYVVLTTKHHDGYSLWPSEYTKYGTQNYMDGRDLLRPYVDACRKYGLKVGFYFSPRDWSYPGYPQSMVYGEPYKFPEGWTEEQNQAAFDAFYDYTVGQMSELLTRYGKIDVLWFDGMGWTDIKDIHSDKTLAWVRSLQPSIIINPRWGGEGDFSTPEWEMPEEAPEGWWENCVSWSGHWGYSPDAPFETTAAVLARLAKTRAWGGNFLLNLGPAPDGTMPPAYYERTAELAKWMAHSRESLIGADGIRNWQEFSSSPLTARGNKWYLHALPDHWGGFQVNTMPYPPEKITVLRTGDEIPFQYFNNKIKFALPHKYREFMDDVLVLHWENAPEPPEAKN